ncbi:MAG: bifunctional biotin--[acetyl-CoA-carboxylase] ligase/biotin operon repressor BirA [Salinisphaeraceae bacterium]|nr:bifunctional biotin--[acetyl-CoA-carboxylase] ligase/biotin operon repressor BirA [Salinisphaeraceae bacterium]
MDRSQRLIHQLADGQWHSGQALAELLEVSRAAVWKRLQALEALGLELESRHGKGYRLTAPIELLDESAIRQAMLAEQNQQLNLLKVFSSLDSTNAWLMTQTDAPAVAMAEHQTAGRGRRGRAWCSPFGANLYFSLAWRFETLPPQLPALSLAVGVVLAETLKDFGATGVGLKWPNDLLWQGRKLAGILIEHQGEAAGPCRVVVGVGLNLAMSKGQGESITQDWVGLYELLGQSQSSALSPEPSRNQLAGQLLSRLMQALQQFSQHGFAPFQPRWSVLDVSRDQKVRIEQPGGNIEGVAEGVDRDGALLIRVRGERQRFFSGEVSLRTQS